MDFSLCSPESMGISSDKLLKLIKELNKRCSMHAFSVLRGEKTVLECCWRPFDGRRHVLNSFAKSVNVQAVGMAIEEGLLSLDDRPAEMFKELLPDSYDERVTRITVKDLLRMTSSSVGLSTDFSGVTGSWITHYFTYPVPNEPGTKFMYESGASFMLSAMVSKVYGKSVYDLLNERLFKPMDIDAYWLASPEGITCGGWGLYLSLRDMAKLACLFVSGGVWEGKRLLSESWLGECTKKQVDIDMPDMCTGYGYQFWTGKYGTFLAFGSVGQLAVCHPESGTVLVAQSGCSDIQLIYLERALVSFFEDPPGDPLPADETAEAELGRLSSGLAKPVPKGARAAECHLSFDGASLDVSGDTLVFCDPGRTVRAGYGHYAVTGGKAAAYVKNEDGIMIRSYDLESCFEEKITLLVTREGLLCTVRKNAVLGEQPLNSSVLYKSI